MSQRIANPPWAFVDQQSGSDSNGGTQAHPMATFAGGARKLPRGGTIFVASSADIPYVGSTGLTVSVPLKVRPWKNRYWYLTGTAAVGYGFRILGTVAPIFYGARVTGLSTSGIRIGDTGQSAKGIIAYDSYAHGLVNGWQSAGVWESIDLYRSQGLGEQNDGFNWHGDPGVHGIARHFACLGEGCGDEGMSPHDDVEAQSYLSTWRGNGGGGVNAVGNAIMRLDGDLIEGNGNGDYGGAGWLENSSGSLGGGTILRNNFGPGVQRVTTGTVTLGDYLSEDNSAADIL